MYPAKPCKDMFKGTREKILVSCCYFTLSAEDNSGISEGLKPSVVAVGKLFLPQSVQEKLVKVLFV